MTFEIIAKLLGGIGLFLLGVELMRSGLKSAAGNSLRRILSDYANTVPRALFSGFVVSTAIQSAGAVTLTLIGFVNAQILSLRQAVTIVFGANLGKIATAWIITSIGLKVNLGVYTLPLIGIGVFAKSFLPNKYSGYLHAMVGFATIYLGLSFLDENVTYIAEHVQLEEWFTRAHFGHAFFFIFGFMLTSVTQSSSAALAIALASTSAGIIPAYNAADIIVGLNLGTTTNSYFVSLKLSSNARRLAVSHIAFNLICTVVGFILIVLTFNYPALPHLARFIEKYPIDGLTLFYTLFIAISMMIALPFKTRLVAWLKHHFFDASLLSSPSYIDPIKHKNAPPLLALEKLQQEAIQFGVVSSTLLKDALEWSTKNGWVYSFDLSEKESELDSLNEYLHHYATSYIHSAPESEISKSMQSLCRSIQHFGLSSDLSNNACTMKNKLTDRLDNASIDHLTDWSHQVEAILDELVEILKSGQMREMDSIYLKIESIDKQRRILRYTFTEESMMGRIKSTQASAIIDIVEACRKSLVEILRGTTRIWKFSDVSSVLQKKILSGQSIESNYSDSMIVESEDGKVTSIREREKL